jgi:peptidoglycan/LPS O-acetylase OafA/YrhL
VQVFWCISGFIFFARYGRSVSSGEESPRRFAWARFSRLYPLHLLTLFAVAALQWVYVDRHGESFVYQNNDFAHFAAQLAMASSWQIPSGPHTYSFNGPIWSVSLELIAYFAFFVVARRFGSSLATVISMLVAVVFVDKVGGHHPVFSCIVYFYLGALVFRSSEWVTGQRRRTAIISALGAALSAAALIALNKTSVSVAMLVIAPAALLVAALSCQRSGPLVGRTATVLGNTTYASYLLHFPLQLLCVLGMEALGVVRPLAAGWFFITYMAVTFLLAAVCYEFFEWPAQQWLRMRFARRSPEPGLV